MGAVLLSPTHGGGVPESLSQGLTLLKEDSASLSGSQLPWFPSMSLVKKAFGEVLQRCLATLSSKARIIRRRHERKDELKKFQVFWQSVTSKFYYGDLG